MTDAAPESSNEGRHEAGTGTGAGARAWLGRRLAWPGGLSTRLLILTVAFALAAGLMILIPSLADYQEARFYDRVRAAELASLAVEAAPARTVSNAMAAQLLNGAGVVSVAVQSGGVRRLLLEAPSLRRTPDLIDLRNRSLPGWAAQPFITLFSGDGRTVRVVAKPRFRDGDFVEVLIPDAPLKRELGAYLLRLVWVALFIAAVAGAALYVTLTALLVRPIQRLTGAMEQFRADPEDPAAHVELSGRRDEIGRAEAELDRMQSDLRAALASRARLAALGEAVAKISHDLRNMLTSAQIASDRLATLGDPRVSQALPRLERALERANALAENVLNYGKSQEAAPLPMEVPLLAAIEAAAEDAGLTPDGVRLLTDIKPGDQVLADPEQLHRILLNLLRNAREAIESTGKAGSIRASLLRQEGQSVVRLADNGPGLTEKAVQRLFHPFAGSGRAGGAGLGLAISRELAQGHRGDLALLENGPRGATFALTLPGVPPSADLGLSHGGAPAERHPVSRSARHLRAAGPRRPGAPRRAP
jgi:signal transduction histidine kinase